MWSIKSSRGWKVILTLLAGLLIAFICAVLIVSTLRTDESVLSGDAFKAEEAQLRERFPEKPYYTKAELDERSQAARKLIERKIEADKARRHPE